MAVRDCSCVLADQACVMLPADMGAEVIKIETQVGELGAVGACHRTAKWHLFTPCSLIVSSAY
ncbi:hypothetical protein [Ralstonia sp. GP71]|uniref:hypothetical protein n=1 Tax=Ralstonia sp. GP71 TaxID=3035152 RepID=UPI003892A76A